MSYQSKTTLLTITVEYQNLKEHQALWVRLSAAYAVASLIASRCQMDIMCVTPYTLAEKGEESNLAVVYVNNGRSLADIIRLMAPEIKVEHDKDLGSVWRLGDIESVEGRLSTIVAMRSDDEGWE